MGNFARSIAYALSFITAFQPLVSSAAVLRYNYAYGWGTTQTDPGEGTQNEWVSAPTVYGDWTNVGNLYGCSNWSPSTSSQGKGITFTQTATDCDQDQERLAQARKKNKATGEVVDSGAPYTEHRTTDATDTREAVGILENWSAIAPTYTEWLNTNTFYSCLSWSPSPSIYQETISFTQTASCKTDQERTRQDREQEQNTGDIRDSGVPVKENQTLNGQLASRNYAVTVSDWIDVGPKNSCTNWSPDPATIDLDVEFTQTATDCIQPQSRTRHEAYTDHKTGSVVSLPQTTETQELTDQTDERTLKGTKIPLAINVTGASASFVDSPFTLNWSGNGMTGYSIRSNNAGAGLPTSDVSVGTTTSTTVTPTAVGTHTYTVTAINSFDETLSADKSVIVEALPSLAGLKVNGAQSITVAPGTTLTFAPTGISSGSTLQGRSEDNSTSSALPLKSSATAGVATYYAAAVKTVNNVTKTSAAKSVQVTVVDAPSITSFTAPSSAFVGSSVNLAWTTKNATTYTVRGSDAASGVSTTDVAVTSSSIGISPTAAGNFTYILTATNAAGVQTTSSVGVQVESDPVISSFSTNTSSVASGSNVVLSWTTSTPTSLSIDQSVGAVTGTSKSVNVGGVAGQKSYSLTISRTLNGETRTATKSVDILVVAAPTVAIDTAPVTNVFVNSPFTLGWTGTDIVSSSIAGNVAASGISTTPVALGAAKTRAITPTAAGTYTYTVTATNSVGITTTATKSIIVEALPVVTSLTSNPTTVTVDQNVTLSWVATGTSMAIDQSVGAVTGSSKVVSVGSVTGAKTYTLTTSTTLNGVTKTASKSVAVTVIAAPTVAISTAPSTNVFVGSPFTLGWTGTGITSYAIASNAASSGVTTTGSSLGTSTTASITPTAPGTYTYTITSTNSVGTESTAVKTITVEAAPTVTSFTSSATSATTGQNVTLSWVADGSTQSIDQSVGSVTGTSKVVAVGTVTGAKTYTLTTSKTLNGVTLTATKSVSITVVAAPTVSINSAPSTNVFVSSPFTLGWTGTGVTKYTIAGNVAASGVATTAVDLATATTYAITPTAVGTYTYTITATNAIGATSTDTRTIIVEALPVVSTFTANPTSVTAGQNTTLTWASTGVSLNIDQSVGAVTGTSKAIAVGTTTGSKTYTLTASTTLNGVTKTATKSVAITVVAAPVVSINTVPATNVFVGSPFTLGWTGSGVTQYTITGNTAASGIATTPVDLATATSRAITPTAAGTYTYTITATNSLGAVSTATQVIIVEALPVVSTFTANPTSVTVGQNVTLAWASTGVSFNIDQSVGVVTGTSVATSVGTTAGAKIYTLTASTTLNGVTKTASKSVTVTVVAAPTVIINTAPATNVFVSSPFTLGWSGTGATKYSIKGNTAASGVATTAVDLATATSYDITPTAAGTYIYTVTATNSLGAVSTDTQTVVVEALPVVSTLTASPTSVTAGQNVTLTWASTGVTFSIDQSVGSVTGNSAVIPVGTVTGAKTYTLTASNTLNGVTKTGTKSVVVTVVAAPIVSINTAPATNVFIGSPFTLGWTGTGVTKYTITGSAAASGIATTPVDLATATSRSITPTAAGTYTYTITATNSLGAVSTDTQTVIVEALPVVSTFTATPTSVTAGQNVTLAWSSTGVNLSIDQSVGTVTGTSVATPVGAATGAKTYTLTASTTLNGVTKTATKTVAITVVAAPTVSINSAPTTNVFIGLPFTLGWSGTGATKYSIKGNTAASGVATTAVDLATATTYAITPTAAGSYTYTVTATNSLGAVSTDTVTIIAEALPVVSTLTASPTSVTAGQNVTLNWASTGDDLSIDQSVGAVTGTSKAIPVGAITGAKTYALTASTTLNGVTKTATKSVAITIVAAPTVTIDTAPSTNVFINSPFTLGWTGTGVTKYTITGSSAASGIATTAVDLGVTTSRVITPTAAGTYTYTITATNSLGAIITDTQTIIVEALPVVSALTASPTSVTAGQNVTLTWASTGASLSIDQSVGTVTGTSLAVPVGTVTGAKTYVMTATTTLNGVTKTATKSVAITIVAAPTVSISTAPTTNVFLGSPFTLGWTGTGATSYSIKGSNAASGVATTDTSLALATTTDITPTGAGTFTYTITAINSLGAKVTATKTVIVEAAPSISTFTITPASLVAAGTNATLAWTTSAVTSLVIDQGVGTVTGTSKSVPVGAVAGAKTYTMTLTRTLNGVTKTATKSAGVTVVLAPTVSITATPATNVYVGSPFTLGWSGTNVSSYSIVSDAAGSGIATTAVNLGTTATQSITPTVAGSYTYTVTATNSVGVTSTVSDTIIVEDAPAITTLTATPTSVTADTSVALTWVTTGSPTLTIDQGVGAVTGTTTSVNVGTTAGSKTYTLTATKVLNGITKTTTKSVAVTVIAAPTVSIGTAPATNVFSGSAFTLGWTGTGVTSYTITGSAAASGIATTPVAMGTSTTRSITPTAAGTYTYTVTAVNSLGATITDTQSVTVEAAPSVTTFTATPASVATGANTTLAWVTSTPTSLSVDQGVGAVTGTSKAVAVGTTAGVKAYTLTITRTLNGITKTATKAVNVTVVAAPTVTINTKPSTNVFTNTPFTLGWTGTDVTSYSIKGSAAASGETTANTALGSAISRSITPTAAGTYTYTITATNAVGVTATATQQIIVEALPTLTAFTANPATVDVGGSTTLSWTQTNATTMTIDQGVGAVTGSSKAVAVGNTAGVKTFSMTVSKVLNGVTKSATLSVPVAVQNWVATTPVYGTWTNVSAITGCTAWAPSPSNYTTATQFTQTGTGCNVTQNRTRQDRQVESATGAVRNVGSVVTESQNVAATTTREYLMDFTAWANSGGYYGCSAWSPAASTVTIGTVFTQAAYCSINQSRAAAGYTWGGSSWVSDPAVPIRSETKVLSNQYATQSATGTKETWAATTPTYTAWANSSGLYSCGGYSPDPSAYTTPTQFVQTAYCYVNQSRTRQDRQYETTTGAIRNVGAPVAESQTIGGQPTTRWYLMDFNAWNWAGDYYACSGWSPDPSTVNSGVAFTQTAYCYRNQQRGAAGYTLSADGTYWVPDPAVPYRVETAAYSGQPIYNTAYGTKPTTVCRWDANNYYSETYFQHNDLYNYRWVWDGATISSSFNTPGGYSKGAQMTSTQWQICRL